MFRSLTLFLIFMSIAEAFVQQQSPVIVQRDIQNDFALQAKTNGDKEKIKGGFLDNFMRGLDEQIDDFMNKRMGQGEVFYGKRKSNPSGEFDGDYEGMGLSDYMRIETAKVRKEEFLEERRQRNRN